MLLLTFEGFSPVALSCYGSSWNRTESIDEIAANGTTWDRVITNTTDPINQLARWLRQAEFNAETWTLVTDDQRLGDLPEIDRIGELIVVPPNSTEVADLVEQTSLAMLAAVAAEQIADDANVWMHSRFLTRCWDAPRDLFATEHFDEMDFGPLNPSESIEEEMREIDQAARSVLAAIPPILNDWQPPAIQLSTDDDPDWIITWMRTYGCQIRLIDTVVGLLRGVATEHGRGSLMVAGTSGFALGQNGSIGHRIGPVRSCQLHVPCLSTDLVPNGSSSGVRNRHVTACDTIATHWCDDSIAKGTISPQDWANNDTPEPVVTVDDEKPVAVTEQGWFYVEDRDLELPTDAPEKLFLKPDDLCDANNVTRLRPDVLERLSEMLAGRLPK